MCKQLLISIDYTFFKKKTPQLFINIHFQFMQIITIPLIVVYSCKTKGGYCVFTIFTIL